MEPERKVALVTGGSTMIGRAICLALARGGADVVVNYRTSADGARSCVADIEALGRSALAYQADINDPAAVDGMVSAAVARLGGLHILVNAAGVVAPKKKVSEWTVANWDEIVNTTLRSAFFTTQRALPQMEKAGWGRIVFISTTATKLANDFRVPYIAAKGGVEAMTRALAIELAPCGITVNAVAPPVVPVERNRTRWDFYEKYLVPYIPAGRMARPEDIAEAVAFFGLSASAYVTGQILTVDGGWSSRPAYPLE